MAITTTSRVVYNALIFYIPAGFKFGEKFMPYPFSDPHSGLCRKDIHAHQIFSLL